MKPHCQAAALHLERQVVVVVNVVGLMVIHAFAGAGYGAAAGAGAGAGIGGGHSPQAIDPPQPSASTPPQRARHLVSATH